MTVMPTQAYVYRAELERVVDGDTIDVKIDRGESLYSVSRLRLLGVNAPEVHGASRPAGLAATAYVDAWMAYAATIPDWPLVVQTYKTDDFGRYLGSVWRVADGANLSDDLISSGHAVPFMTGRP